jgi:hypothetical protein
MVSGCYNDVIHILSCVGKRDMLVKLQGRLNEDSITGCSYY